MSIRIQRSLLVVCSMMMLAGQTMLAESSLSFSKSSEKRFSIQLRNSEPVAALQFELRASAGIALQLPALYGRTSNASWALFSNSLNDSTMIVILFRSGDSNLPIGEGEIAQFDVAMSTDLQNGRVSFGHVVGSNPQAESITIVTESIEWSLESPIFVLEQNYPNPFNPATTIPYRLLQRTQITLSVYDVAGREIQRVSDGVQEAGSYTITWNGADNSGVRVPSGVYFLRLQAGSASQVRKMVLAK